MSGGIAYVWDRAGDFNLKCNLGTVLLERIEGSEEEAEVRTLIERHLSYTGSDVAKSVLASWDAFVSQCVKVMPIDYKRVLEELRKNREPATAGAGA